MILKFTCYPLIHILQINRLVSTSLSTHNPAKLVKLVEVGPRDGLQNEKSTISIDIKVDLIDRLSAAGLPCIEVSSFVRESRVPQLADAAAVFKRIKRVKGVQYLALVPNKSGLLKAIEANANGVAIFAAASKAFSMKNINCSIQESVERFDEVFQIAKSNHLPVRGYISCVVGCPYEGYVSPDTVAKLTETLWSRGCYEISLCDTIGVGTPESIDDLLSVILNRVGACPKEALAIHCHDTHGNALSNIDLALEKYGIRVIDSSISGLGGCPFAGPGAPGNVSTESVVSYFTKKGYKFTHNYNLNELIQIGKWIRGKIAESRVIT
ncbi:unnamed protein product [Heterobilharzia americana]|nr:unnamed protein product [Heterobilharzia americana]